MFETLFIQVTQRATKICYCERLVIRVLNNPWDTYNALEHQNPDFQKVDSTIFLQWITIRKTNNYIIHRIEIWLSTFWTTRARGKLQEMFFW